jgi:hypothetical protein
MNKRYAVCSPRHNAKADKTFWHRVGTAWEGDKGISVVFDSLPLPDEKGQVRVNLFEPREKNDKPASAAPSAPRRSMKDEMDDDIPF